VTLPEISAYNFAEFRLLPRLRRLERQDGTIVQLGGRSFDLLLALLEDRENFVSKEQLLSRVWPNLVVEDNNLAVAVSSLRKALGQDAIATVARRGYRLVPEVQVEGVSPAEIPAEPSARPKHNLPSRASALIGRDQEQADLAQLLADHRLVTLTGPGGIGKTSLALEATRKAQFGLDTVVVLVEFAALSDGALVAPTVAAALGISLVAERPPLDLLRTELADRRLLLVLDNCEHVVAAAASLADAIMTGAPGVSILATSREPLGLPLERLYRLTPLTLPADDSIAAIEASAAGALLISRARAVDHGFRLEARNAEPIARICRRLDGIPLALEFAAARMPVFGAETIAARLDERFRILCSGSRMALPRHQTLRATLDWSHDLLGEAERIVFRRLGIFAGGCTLEAAEQVVADQVLTGWQVVEPLAGLVSKSLVILDSKPAVPRYCLLETTRAYALEKLDEAGETGTLTRRLTQFLVERFDSAYDSWQTTPDARWLAIHGPELDNVRIALDWSFGATGAPELGQALAGSAHMLWREQALFSEARQRIGAAVDRLDKHTPPTIAARLWLALGDAWAIIDQPRGLSAREHAAAISRSLNEPQLLGDALTGLVGSLSKGDRLAEAEACGKEALALLEDGRAPKSLAVCLSILAIPTNRMGRLAEARDFTRRALEIERRVGCDRGMMVSLLNLAELNFTLGAIDDALAGDREVVELLRRSGSYPHILASVLGNLAGHLIMAGQIVEADERGREATPALAQIGEIQLVVHCLQYTPLLAAQQGRLADAARLAGYVDAAFQRAGEVPDYGGLQVFERLNPLLDAAFDPDRIATLRAEGASWAAEDAVKAAFP
jgi:predicted ATPase/DNA-binding winged helix-turn-helix (wHTH) protein